MPLVPSRRHLDSKAVFLQGTAHQIMHGRIVVYHQNSRGRRAEGGCGAGLAAEGAGSSAGSFTSAGSVTVKVLPLPYSLVAVRSPPIMWQNLRLIAKPSPVPPYLRLVDNRPA